MSEHPISSSPDPDLAAPTVAVVLVCHNGEHYLPRTLRAIAELDPAPSSVVAVDSGSTDATPQLLSEAVASGVVDRVLNVPSGTGFAEAVHLGVEGAPDSDWLWLLHDDSAPDPDALGVLLQAALDQPSVGVWGPKVLGWDEPRRLLEIGVSISRSGRRFTGLERGEQDQGQYDGQRDVLAVGSAGLLARRDLWSDLGGFERSMHFFREDVDFGWRVNLSGHRVAVVTDAVVHHAESMARGHRVVSETSNRPISLADPLAHDRASALFTLLANGRSSTLLVRWLWLLLQTLLRAAGFVLGKAPREATAEMAAVGTVLMRPGRVLRVRRSRRRWRTVRQRSLLPLFPPAGQQLRHTIETLVGSLTIEADVEPVGQRGSAPETGPVDDDLDSFVSAGSGRLRRLVRRPGVLLFTGLLLVQLVAWRGLYRGGVLHGGALLPMPRGASDIWQAYTAAWHPVTLGSDTMAHPSSAVLGVLATVLLGHASWVVPVVFVVGPPLAGVLAYQVTTSFGMSRWLRIGIGIAYALNPVTLAATAQGRWTTVLVMVLLPLAGVACARGLGMGRRPPSGRATATAVLLLSAIVALAPPLLVPLVVFALALAVWLRGRRRLLSVALLLGPLLILLPWWSVVVSDPAALVLEPGVRLVSDREAPWHAAFFDPGGSWSLPWWLGVGLTVAALAAVVRARDARPVRVASVVFCAALVWALVLEAITVTPANSAQPVAPWTGSVLVLGVVSALVAAAVAARGVRTRLSQATFSWRQPALAAVTALAVASPVIWGLAWLAHGASDPLDRGTANPLPAFVRAQSALPQQIRTLVLEPAQGRLAYTVLRARDAQWGDVETAPSAEQMQSMDEVVSDLASGRGSAPVDELTERAVQYILAVPPVDDDLEVALDSAPGLLRIANPGDASLWRVQEETGRVRLETSGSHLEVLPSEVKGDPSAAQVSVDASDTDRVLELAELANERWRAVETAGDEAGELDTASTSEWAQGFLVGSDEATVAMSVQNRWRSWLLWAQLGLVVVLILVALPGRARRDQEAV
ncbi:MAG TPA: glycosyltransferase family 2 protein [Actinomycetes bacterium]|nr:glycosyltransferase family 2 protein [Actinomycetes bacterium]